MGFVRQRDILQKKREIAKINEDIKRYEQFCTYDDEVHVKALKDSLTHANRQLKVMQAEVKRFEALFNK